MDARNWNTTALSGDVSLEHPQRVRWNRRDVHERDYDDTAVCIISILSFIILSDDKNDQFLELNKIMTTYHNGGKLLDLLELTSALSWTTVRLQPLCLPNKFNKFRQKFASPDHQNYSHFSPAICRKLYAQAHDLVERSKRLGTTFRPPRLAADEPKSPLIHWRRSANKKYAL